jgi:hypothetical protein
LSVQEEGERDEQARSTVTADGVRHILGSAGVPLRDGAVIDFVPHYWDDASDAYQKYGIFSFTVVCPQLVEHSLSSDDGDDEDEDEDDEDLSAAGLGSSEDEDGGEESVAGGGDVGPVHPHQQYSLKIVIPGVKAGHLVGVGGAHIGQIRTTHGCTVLLSDRQVTHPAAVDIGGRPVFVGGVPRQVAGGVEACFQRMSSPGEVFGGASLVRLIVPSHCAQAVARALGVPVSLGDWDETSVTCTLTQFRASCDAVLSVLGPSPSQYRRDVNGYEVSGFTPLLQPGPGAPRASSAPALQGQRHAHNSKGKELHGAIKKKRCELKKLQRESEKGKKAGKKGKEGKKGVKGATR